MAGTEQPKSSKRKADFLKKFIIICQAHKSDFIFPLWEQHSNHVSFYLKYWLASCLNDSVVDWKLWFWTPLKRKSQKCFLIKKIIINKKENPTQYTFWGRRNGSHPQTKAQFHSTREICLPSWLGIPLEAANVIN